MSRPKGACPCGQPSSGTHREHCTDCRHEMQEIGQAMRWQPIHDMWAAGWTHQQIADVLAVSVSTIGVHVFRMRAAGWDMPYRREWCIPRSRAA